MPHTPTRHKARQVNFTPKPPQCVEQPTQGPRSVNGFDRFLNGVNNLINRWAHSWTRRKNRLHIDDMPDSQRADIGLGPRKHIQNVRDHPYLPRY